MKFLILNADDYGLCESVNQGIIECLQYGIVSDVSFMVNADEFEKSHKMLVGIQRKNIGLHLNFTVGKSILGSKSKLVDKNGYYYDLKTLLFKILLKEVSLIDIYEEIRAQIVLLFNHGYTISHIDSHRNIHLLPHIIKALLQVNEDLNLNVPIRMPHERIYSILKLTKSNWLRMGILNLLTSYCSLRTKYKWEIRTIGGNIFNNSDAATAINDIINVIKKSPYKMFEVAVHPGYPSEKLAGYDNYNRQRLWELKILKDKTALFKTDDVQIGSFNDLFPKCN